MGLQAIFYAYFKRENEREIDRRKKERERERRRKEERFYIKSNNFIHLKYFFRLFSLNINNISLYIQGIRCYFIKIKGLDINNKFNLLDFIREILRVWEIERKKVGKDKETGRDRERKREKEWERERKNEKERERRREREKEGERERKKEKEIECYQ